jgi:site-specific recombinase XerD
MPPHPRESQARGRAPLKDDTVEDLITQWLNLLRLTMSPRTVEGYEYHLRRLAKSAPNRLAHEWTEGQLVAYLAERRAAGNGDSAMNQTTAAFRNFFRWACGANSPAKAIPFPRRKKKVQRTLTADETVRLLAACDSSTVIGKRDLAILEVMLDTGLRASELCALRVDQLDVEARRFLVTIKGGDQAEARISRTTAEQLRIWLQIRNLIAAPDCQTVFIGIGGMTPGRTLKRDGLKGIFRAIANRAGLKGVTPHVMRRTFATLAIKAGAPTRVVQVAGRWGDVQMVERYTQAIRPEDIDRYSPVERLLSGQNN